MCAPRMRSVFASATNFTIPSTSSLQSARLLARNGNLPIRTSIPFSFALSSEYNPPPVGIFVNDAGNRVIIHVTGFPPNDFHAGDPFVFGLVRKHRTRNHIADSVNAFDVRAKMFVHFDALLFVKLHTHFVRAQTV